MVKFESHTHTHITISLGAGVRDCSTYSTYTHMEKRGLRDIFFAVQNLATSTSKIQHTYNTPTAYAHTETNYNRKDSITKKRWTTQQITPTHEYLGHYFSTAIGHHPPNSPQHQTLAPKPLRPQPPEHHESHHPSRQKSSPFEVRSTARPPPPRPFPSSYKP